MWTEEDVEALKLVILRRNRCLDGEHEAIEDANRGLGEVPVSYFELKVWHSGMHLEVKICRHCRSLYNPEEA